MKKSQWMIMILLNALGTTFAQADIISYYIGRDGRTAPFVAPDAVGGGAYPDNPNLGRLTLLLHHGDHYHGIGAYTYSGAAAAPQKLDTNGNNRLPETFTGLAPLSLLPGTGAWAGTFRSGLPSSFPQDEEYGNLEIRNAHSLQGEDQTTYNSSDGRWSGSFASSHIHLELVTKTPGLHISLGSTPIDELVSTGDDVHVGDGDQMFRLLPTFWVEDSASPGSTYQAEFRLTDMNDFGMNSGRFFFDFQVVPEPATSGLVAWAAGVLWATRRRVRRTGN